MYPNQYMNLCIGWYEPFPVFVGSILWEMHQGVNDVLPSSSFDNLTSEDLHQLMNGSPVVDVEMLKKTLSFMDESHKGHVTCHCCKVFSALSLLMYTSLVCAPC